MQTLLFCINNLHQCLQVAAEDLIMHVLLLCCKCAASSMALYSQCNGKFTVPECGKVLIVMGCVTFHLLSIILPPMRRPFSMT